MSIAAYQAVRRATESPRETEARYLRTSAQLLRDAESSKDIRTIANAVHRNQTLWTAFLADLASEHNGLPPGLRASLISIGGAVDRTSSQILAGGPGLDALYDINEKIAKGLTGG